jgi:hypothetical protein
MTGFSQIASEYRNRKYGMVYQNTGLFFKKSRHHKRVRRGRMISNNYFRPFRYLSANGNIGPEHHHPADFRETPSGKIKGFF